MKKNIIDGIAFDIKTKVPVADSITLDFFNQIDNTFRKKLKKRTALYQEIFAKK